MAEEQDREQRTEEPSARKLQQARERGQVAQSREVGNLLTLAGTGIVLVFLAPSLVRQLGEVLTRFIASPHLYAADVNLGSLLRGTLVQVGLLLALPLAVMTAAGLAGPLLQNGLVVAIQRLQPKLSNLSPVAGVHRLFSVRNLVELGKNLVKLALVGGVLWVLLRPELDRMPLLPHLDLAQIAAEIARLTARMIGGVIGVMFFLAVLDFGYQRLSFLRSMRMTKEEVKEEYRQTEGDPRIKARFRQLRVERARRRMMAAVPKATVVVTNPTHYAIAFHYDMETMSAPVVVAKGLDFLAQKIREVAAENDVPVVENPPLARALYPVVEIDQEIPPEHYKAVAEIIGYVFRLQGKLRPAAAAG
ncbi:MAG TPA: flagellar biosynthesis protein FlhB [Stellaceae bacterium]|nr:flagellar biosynthesis protein FlhB [Stellaceae bacterium]